MAALREVLVAFDVEVEGLEELQAISAKLDNIIERTRQVAIAFSAMAGVKAIGNFIDDTIQLGANIGYMADKLGIGTEELQEFQYAAGMVGVSSDQAGRSLQMLERHVGLAATGTKSAVKDFAQLGVSIRDANGNIKPTSELLPEIGEGFNKLKSQPEKLAYSMKVFGRSAGAAMVPVLERLKESSKEFKALGGGIQQDFIDKAKQADRQMTRLRLVFDMMRSRAVLPLIPALETGLDWLMKFFAAMGHLSDITYGAQTALIALGAVAAVALAPLLLETLAIIAPWAALYLLFDDIFTLFEGGDSLIGRTIDALFGLGASKKFVAEVKDEVAQLWERLQELWEAAKDLGPKLAGVWEMSKPAIKWLMSAVAEVGRAVIGFVEALADVAHGDWKKAGDDLYKAGQDMFGDKKNQESEEARKEQENKDYFARFKEQQDRLQNPTLNTVQNTLADAGIQADLGADKGLPGLGGGGMGFSMTGDINVQVAVHGGSTNDQTGSAVGNAAADATAAALRDAHNAVKARK
jgi:hypothetical protein